jgi:hypothetical protein
VDAELYDVQGQIDQATTRLLDTVGRLTDNEARQASLLPGWTRDTGRSAEIWDPAHHSGECSSEPEVTNVARVVARRAYAKVL